MPSVRRQLHLNAFLMTVGHHESAWRFPESDPVGAWDLEHYKHLARTAERGTFDSIFFGDGPALQGDIRYRPVGRLDPAALLPALASATERIGLVATASTTYNEPRRRGLFRDAYTGTTLRDHYGLSRPSNQYSEARRQPRAAGSAAERSWV